MADHEERKQLLDDLHRAADDVDRATKALADVKSQVIGAECSLSNAQTTYRKKMERLQAALPEVPAEAKGEKVDA